jgi:hypothetical protein
LAGCCGFSQSHEANGSIELGFGKKSPVGIAPNIVRPQSQRFLEIVRLKVGNVRSAVRVLLGDARVDVLF